MQAPKGYEEDAAKLRCAIQMWVMRESESRLVDLGFRDWGRSVYFGPLNATTIDYLATTPDARAMLLWADEASGHKASLLQAYIVLQQLGLLVTERQAAAPAAKHSGN
jgi:hypothetical protein